MCINSINRGDQALHIKWTSIITDSYHILGQEALRIHCLEHRNLPSGFLSEIIVEGEEDHEGEEEAGGGEEVPDIVIVW